jgi:hypothetical protein
VLSASVTATSQPAVTATASTAIATGTNVSAARTAASAPGVAGKSGLHDLDHRRRTPSSIPNGTPPCSPHRPRQQSPHPNPERHHRLSPATPFGRLRRSVSINPSQTASLPNRRGQHAYLCGHHRRDHLLLGPERVRPVGRKRHDRLAVPLMAPTSNESSTSPSVPDTPAPPLRAAWSGVVDQQATRRYREPCLTNGGGRVVDGRGRRCVTLVCLGHDKGCLLAGATTAKSGTA